MTLNISKKQNGIWKQGFDLPPSSAHGIIRHSHRLIGPLFLYHPESEFSAVCLPMSSRLAANSLAISFGVLSPSAL